MEELTIKKEEIEDGEFDFDTKENILVQDGIIQEVQSNIDQENGQEVMTIEKHEFLEDSCFDSSKSKESDSLYLNVDHVHYSAVCKEIQSNCDLEDHQEITIDKHEFLEDSRYDCSKSKESDSLYLNGVHGHSSAVCKEIQSNCELKSHQEITIDKHEFLEDVSYDYSNCQQTSPTNQNGVFNYGYGNCQQASPTNLNVVYDYGHSKYYEYYSAFHNRGYAQFPDFRNTNQRETPKVDKQFRCSQCSFSTLYKDSLRFHTLALHSKEKPFKCNECEKSFAGNYMLTTHIKNVHMRDKSFKCNECQYSCKFESVLESHIQAIHRKYKPFQCGLCEFSTNYKCSLKSHMLSVHNKARPFKCSHCDYSCAFKSTLTQHIKKYHDERNN